MTETTEVITEQQETPPAQPSSSAPAPQAVDWEARYKGAVPTMEKLTIENRNLRDQQAQVTSKLEQLQAQLELKGTEKSVAVGERDKTIEQLLTEKSQLQAEVDRLKAVEMKVRVANKIGDPSLISIIDTIPSVADEEALETLMTSVSNWGSGKVKDREQELMAGENMPSTPPTTPIPDLPTNIAGWQDYVNQAELGSQEREKRMEAWKDWGLSQQK